LVGVSASLHGVAGLGANQRYYVYEGWQPTLQVSYTVTPFAEKVRPYTACLWAQWEGAGSAIVRNCPGSTPAVGAAMSVPVGAPPGGAASATLVWGIELQIGVLDGAGNEVVRESHTLAPWFPITVWKAPVKPAIVSGISGGGMLQAGQTRTGAFAFSHTTPGDGATAPVAGIAVTPADSANTFTTSGSGGTKSYSFRPTKAGSYTLTGLVTGGWGNPNGVTTATTITVNPAQAATVSPAVGGPTPSRGATSTLSCLVKDSFGNTVATSGCVWSSTGAGDTIAGNTITWGQAAGTRTVSATYADQTGSSQVTIDAVPSVGEIAGIEAVAGTQFTHTIAPDAWPAAVSYACTMEPAVAGPSTTLSWAGNTLTGVATKAGSLTAVCIPKNSVGPGGWFTVPITVAPGPAHKLTLTPSATEVDRGAKVAVVIVARDRWDNPVEVPAGSVTWNSDTPGDTATAAGVAIGQRSGVHTLTATLGEARQSVEVTVRGAPVVSPPARVDAVVGRPVAVAIPVDAWPAATAQQCAASGGVRLDWNGNTVTVTALEAGSHAIACVPSNTYGAGPGWGLVVQAAAAAPDRAEPVVSGTSDPSRSTAADETAGDRPQGADSPLTEGGGGGAGLTGSAPLPAPPTAKPGEVLTLDQVTLGGRMATVATVGPASGILEVGSTLEGSAQIPAGWTAAWRWHRSAKTKATRTQPAKAVWKPIKGATHSAYTPGPADAGKRVRARVVLTDGVTTVVAWTKARRVAKVGASLKLAVTWRAGKPAVKVTVIPRKGVKNPTGTVIVRVAGTRTAVKLRAKNRGAIVVPLKALKPGQTAKVKVSYSGSAATLKRAATAKVSYQRR
jgi:hypothetical protein